MAAEMRAAEAEAVAAGTSVETLMERAGAAAAEAIARFGGPMAALLLCGPGNNGGDGYVIARLLRDRGVPVRVAALGEPASPAAKAARDAWGGPVEQLADAEPAPLLVDALFGTGLSRPLDEGVAARLLALAGAARVRVAVDLPSGVASDDGNILSPVPNFDMTVTFATLKPSHLLQPAAAHMGRVVVADIGVRADSALQEIGRPRLAVPGSTDHKYSRGLVTVIAGELAGASALAAAAAQRAGAGAVRLQAPSFVAGVPAAVIQKPGDPLDRLDDERIGALLLGPGLAPSEGEALLAAALDCGAPLVLDAGALGLLAGIEMPRFRQTPIFTPHAGEFGRLFSDLPGSKLEQTRAAVARSGAVIAYKGSDSVVAAPDGRAAIARSASHWLASGGTGDVLAGTIAAMRAGGMDAFEAACAGLWLHGAAARQAGPGLIADDLVAALPLVLRRCV